jgi:(R,R)-butanediol dehydrogenase/meso-butanediol dehydrogenase/diacetyl reductase
MKAVMWFARRDVRVVEVPEPPAPPEGFVKIEVSYCGLCGSDVHEYAGGPLFLPASEPHPLTGVKTPVILGHEIAARVFELGIGVDTIQVGDRIALSPMFGCGECEWCQQDLIGLCPKAAVVGFAYPGGGYSRFINVKSHWCFKLPPEVSDEMGALVGPVAEAMRATSRVDVQPGEIVAVIGCGPIGLCAVQTALAAGASQIIALEPIHTRRLAASRCGAQHTIDPLSVDPLQAVKSLTGGKGVDAVIECGGSPATGILAGRIARTRGRIVILGIFEAPAPFDYFDLVTTEKTVMGSVSGFGGFPEAIELMKCKKLVIEPLITSKITLDEVPRKLEALASKEDENIKILVFPT